MKKSLIKIIAFAIAAIFTTSVFAGCDSCENDSANEGNTSGNHVIRYTDTDKDLVLNGTTEYKIVIEKDASDIVVFAAEELAYFFKLATDLSIETICDDSAVYSEQAKYISVGNNAIFAQSGIKTDELGLSHNGYLIKTVGQSIFIVGNNDFAAPYGVYGFLEIEFGFDQFSGNIFSLNRGVRNLKLKNYDVKDIPDINIRRLTNPFMTENATTMYRLKLVPANEDLNLGPATVHSSFTHFPKDTYLDPINNPDNYHPKWYSDDGTQLCWLAHGDETEYNAMVDVLVERVKRSFISHPNALIYSITQADKYTWCQCDACLAETAKYGGSNASSMVKLCNKVAERVDEWLATEEGAPYDRDYRIFFLAYNKTLAAPVNYDAKTDTFSTIDGLRCHKHVSVYIAPIERSFVKSVTEEENSRFYNALRGWQTICDNISYFDYIANYNDFMVCYDTFNTMKESVKNVVNGNGYMMSALGEYGQSEAATGWQFLKSYLYSKLMWNSDIDIDEYTKKFFDNFYDAGAENMLKYYLEYRIQSKYALDSGLMKATGVYGLVIDKGYFPKNSVLRWLDYVNAAIEDIGYLKQIDPDAYTRIHKNIVAERVSLYYMLVKLYANEFSSQYLLSLKNQCKDDCAYTGITACAEGKPISEVWDSWGINS